MLFVSDSKTNSAYLCEIHKLVLCCSQMDIAMACQQQYTIQTATAQGFQSPLMATVPQTLQVIQTAGPHQVVQQQCVQQQYMFQANQVQSKCSVGWHIHCHWENCRAETGFRNWCESIDYFNNQKNYWHWNDCQVRICQCNSVIGWLFLSCFRNPVSVIGFLCLL